MSTQISDVPLLIAFWEQPDVTPLVLHVLHLRMRVTFIMFSNLYDLFRGGLLDNNDTFTDEGISCAA